MAFLFPTVFSLKLVSKRYFDALSILGSEFWFLAALEKLALCFLDQAAAEEASATPAVLALVSRSSLLSSAQCCLLVRHSDCLLLNLMGEGFTVVLFGENGHYLLKTYLPSLPQFLSLGILSWMNETARVGPIAPVTFPKASSQASCGRL